MRWLIAMEYWSIPSGNRHEHLESLSHFSYGLIVDQQRFAVRRDIEEGVAIDFVLDWVDLRALELATKKAQTVWSGRRAFYWWEWGTIGGKEWEMFEGGRPILNDLVWPQATV